MSVRECFLKTGFTTAYFSCSGNVLVSKVLFTFVSKNLEKMSELYLIILVGMSLLWVAFQASNANISLQISSVVTNLKEKQSEESLASLIFRMLAWWEKFSIVFRTGSSLKSDKMGRSIVRVLTIFSKWSLNFLTTSFTYNLVSINKGYSFIFESRLSKIWFDSLPELSFIG